MDKLDISTGLDVSLTADVNTFFKDFLEVFGSDSKYRENYQKRLSETGVPKIQDWFAGYGTDYSNSNQMIIMALIAVVVVVIIASMFTGK